MESAGQDTAAGAGHSPMASGTAEYPSTLLLQHFGETPACSQRGGPFLCIEGRPEPRGINCAQFGGKALPERLCWRRHYNKAIILKQLGFAGQWLPAPGELEGAASDGLDPAAERHHTQRLHASHPRRSQGWEDVQAQLLCGRNLVRHRHLPHSCSP